jgi:hypothetical protein
MVTGPVNRGSPRSTAVPELPPPPEVQAQQVNPAPPRRARPIPQPGPVAENRPAAAGAQQINPQRARMLRQQALTRLHNMAEATQTAGAQAGRFGLETLAHFGQQALAVGATTFGRQQLGEYLETALVHLPIKHQIAIFTAVQVLHVGLQGLRTQQLYRDPEAAAQALAGESSAQWAARTGIDGNRTPEQQIQLNRSMRDLNITAASVALVKLAATAINTGLIVHGTRSNNAELTSSVVANEIKMIPYAIARDAIQALVSFVSAHPDSHGQAAVNYRMGAAAYSVTNAAANFSSIPFNQHIKATAIEGGKRSVRQAAVTALFNTIVETMDWQIQNKLEQHHAENAPSVTQDAEIGGLQVAQGPSPRQQGLARPQQFGLSSSPQDLSRILNQSPGRLAYLSMPNAVDQAATVALSHTSLSSREQKYAVGLIAALGSAVGHLAVAREWDAQSAVRTAVRNRSNDTDGSSGGSASTEYYDAPSRLSTDSSSGVAPSNAGSSDDDTDSSSQYHDARSRL